MILSSPGKPSLSMLHDSIRQVRIAGKLQNSVRESEKSLPWGLSTLDSPAAVRGNGKLSRATRSWYSRTSQAISNERQHFVSRNVVSILLQSISTASFSLERCKSHYYLMPLF